MPIVKQLRAPRRGPIRRAVVNDDDLDSPPRLGQGRVDRIGDERLRVERRDEDGNQRLHDKP